MNRQELFKDFKEILSPSFKTSGFTYSKEIGGMQFLRTTDFGFERVIITFGHYGNQHDFGGGTFSIKIPQLISC